MFCSEVFGFVRCSWAQFATALCSGFVRVWMLCSEFVRFGVLCSAGWLLQMALAQSGPGWPVPSRVFGISSDLEVVFGVLFGR